MAGSCCRPAEGGRAARFGSRTRNGNPSLEGPEPSDHVRRLRKRGEGTGTGERPPPPGQARGGPGDHMMEIFEGALPGSVHRPTLTVVEPTGRCRRRRVPHIARPDRTWREGRIAGMRLGIAHHFGWAVAVTATADHQVLDRRRLELIEPGLPAAPIHHEGGTHEMHGSVEPPDDITLAALVRGRGARRLSGPRRRRWTSSQRHCRNRSSPCRSGHGRLNSPRTSPFNVACPTRVAAVLVHVLPGAGRARRTHGWVESTST